MEERVRFSISTAELERRWRAVRGDMAEQGLDALVIQNSNDWLGGYVKWFTDIPATNAYPRSIVFPRDDRMTVVEQGPFGGVEVPPEDDPDRRGIGRVLGSPSYSSIEYSRHYDADLVAGEIWRAGYRNIGVVNAAGMYYEFGARLREGLPGVRFVDATDLVDRIKCVKSEEEISWIRRTAAMQDEVMAAVAKHIRPGLKDGEISAFAQYTGHLLGSEQGIFLASSAPPGRAAVYRPRRAQGRELRQGDTFTLLVENNGPGGFYTEIARTFVLGKPSQELVDGIGQILEAQEQTLRRLKPGAACGEILEANNAFLRERGLPEEKRLYAHGQGYDMVERPLLRQDETMPIAESMNIVVHPSFVTPSVHAVICDNYLIGPGGPGECLHRTPKKVLEI